SSLAQDLRASSTATAQKNILIVYLSRTQNTAVVADIIQEQVGGRLEPIELQTPYPADYDAIVAQVARENDTGYLPPLKTEIQNIRTYDILFVGFPTWGMQLPPPVKSFLKRHDLSGKTVVPFNTHGGYGAGSTFQSIEQLCPKSKVIEGLSVRGGLERDGIELAIKGERRDEVARQVTAWLRRAQLF
ncbi:MAG TPA: flavodoxin, partial [Bryobacteraceae bacterium]|nr:flavodoxin [Bryobacteraceae bacterium]